MSHFEQIHPAVVLKVIDRMDAEISDVSTLVKAATFYADQIADPDTRRLLLNLLCDAQDAVVRLEVERDAFEPKLISICGSVS